MTIVIAENVSISYDTVGNPMSSNEKTPKQESSDHTWRGAATGDDEIIITEEHPQYALGPYWIGVYSVRDSEYELFAELKEPPTKRP